MAGALCGKKRCNNTTSLELPIQKNNQNNQNMKRSYDSTGQANYDYVMAKRRTMEIQQQQQQQQQTIQVQNNIQIQQQQQQRIMTIPAQMQPNGDQNGYPHIMNNTIRLVQHQPIQPGQQMNLLMPMTSMNNNDVANVQQTSQHQVVEVMPLKDNQQQSTATVNGTNGPTIVTVPHSNMGIQAIQPQNGVYHYVQSTDMMGQIQNAPQMHQQFAYIPSQKVFNYPKYEPKYEYYECDPNRSPQDPYVPPSYSTDVKNGVVLQPL